MHSATMNGPEPLRSCHSKEAEYWLSRTLSLPKRLLAASSIPRGKKSQQESRGQWKDRLVVPPCSRQIDFEPDRSLLGIRPPTLPIWVYRSLTRKQRQQLSAQQTHRCHVPWFHRKERPETLNQSAQKHLIPKRPLADWDIPIAYQAQHLARAFRMNADSKPFSNSFS